MSLTLRDFLPAHPFIRISRVDYGVVQHRFENVPDLQLNVIRYANQIRSMVQPGQVTYLTLSGDRLRFTRLTDADRCWPRGVTVINNAFLRRKIKPMVDAMTQGQFRSFCVGLRSGMKITCQNNHGIWQLAKMFIPDRLDRQRLNQVMAGRLDQSRDFPVKYQVTAEVTSRGPSNKLFKHIAHVELFGPLSGLDIARIEPLIGTSIEQQYLDRFERSSVHVVAIRITGWVRIHEQANLLHHRMRAVQFTQPSNLRFQYNQFDQMSDSMILRQYTGSCVINYIKAELERFPKRNMSITPLTLIKQFVQINPCFRPPEIRDEEWGVRLMASGKEYFRCYYRRDDAMKQAREAGFQCEDHPQMKCVTYYETNNFVQQFIHYGKRDVALTKVHKKVSNMTEQFGLTTNDIMEWAKTFMPTVSIYALTPFFKVFEYHQATKSPKIVMAFIVNGDHLTPITREGWKKSIAHSGKFDPGLWKNQSFRTKVKFVTQYISSEHKDGDFVAVIDCDDLTETVINVMNETGFMVFNLQPRRSKIHSFLDPTKDVVVECADEYKEREALCARYHSEFNSPRFANFTNQTWARLGLDYMECLIGDIPLSRLSGAMTKMVDDYEPKPLMQTIDNTTYTESSVGIDICRCYATVARENQYDYPVFSEFDTMVPYHGGPLAFGEYMVEEFHVHGLRITRSLWSREAIDYFLSMGFITREYITHVFVARKKLPANLLKEFMEKNRGLKLLCNIVIGRLNSKFTYEERAFLTTSSMVVSATVMDQAKRGKECRITDVAGVYCVHSSDKRRRLGTHSSIWRHIISGSVVALLKLVCAAMTPESTLVGVTVDSVFINNPNEQFMANLPAEYRMEDWKPRNLSVLPHREPYLWSPCVWKKGPGLVTGIGGSGKTRWLVREFYRLTNGHDQDEMDTDDSPTLDVKLFAFTNNAVNNLIKRGKNFGVTRANCMTLSRWSLLFKNGKVTLPDVVMVDEMSMIPKMLMSEIYTMFTRGCRVVLIGDTNQCRPVEVDKVYYKWEDSELIHEMVGGLCEEKPYIEGSSRFDKPLYTVLMYFLESGRLHPCLKDQPIDPDLRVNIVKLNKTRDEINKKFCPGDYELDMPVIIDDKLGTLKKHGLYNSTIHKVQFVTEEGIRVYKNRHVIPRKLILPAYAVTCYKYQGSTIFEPHNVFVRKMTKEEAATALSRAKRLSDIHIEWIDRVFESPNCNECVSVRIKKGSLKNVLVNHGKVTYKRRPNSRTKEWFMINRRDELILVMKPIVKPQIYDHDRSILYAGNKYKIAKTGDSWRFQYWQGRKRINMIVRTSDEELRRQQEANLEAVRARVIKQTFEPELPRTLYVPEMKVSEVREARSHFRRYPERVTGLFLRCIWYGYMEPAIDNGRYVVWGWVESCSWSLDPKKLSHFYTNMSIKRAEKCMDSIGYTEEKEDWIRSDNFASALEKEEAPCYLYEMCHENCRLMCDVDFGKWKRTGCTPLSIAQLIVELVGRVLLFLDWPQMEYRISNATTKKKLSLHIVWIGYVFKYFMYQKAFWAWVKVFARKYTKYSCLFQDQFIIDTVWDNRRMMRTLGSRKCNQDNELIAMVLTGEKPEDIIWSEYLVNDPKNTNYLEYDEEFVKFITKPKPRPKASKRQKVTHTNVSADILEIIRRSVPNCYETRNLEQRGSFIRLNRTSPGHCDQCGRHHDVDNAFVFVGSCLLFKCYRFTGTAKKIK